MSKLVNVTQGTQEWLEFRRNTIGSSDAPIIMGVSPWRTPLQLWKEKVGGHAGQEMTPWMKRGHDLEEDARKIAEHKLGVFLLPLVYQSSVRDWASASFDGINLEEGKAVEIKCPGIEDHKMAMEGKVPDKYYPQLQHQLMVSELQEIYYMSYRDEQYNFIPVKRDFSYIKEMLNKEEEFYRCMMNLIPPDDGYIEREDQEWSDAEMEYMEAYNISQMAEKRKEDAKKRLLELAQGENTKGKFLKLKTVFSKGRIDYNNIPLLKGMDLEDYRSPPSQSVRIDRL